MNVHYFELELEQARAAARHIEEAALHAISVHGRFVFAASGGKSPRALYRELALRPLDWARIDLFQVDERVLPLGDAGRNRTLLEESLLSRLKVRPRVHWMPVELPSQAAASAYEEAILGILGRNPRFDLIHLGLGADGHTASLVPGDHAALSEDSRLVVAAQEYQGTERLTLTFPLLCRAHELLWFVAGADKARALEQLQAHDLSIPASRLAKVPSTLFVHRG